MKIMILAGGNDQAALIQELRKQVPGVYVILIDMVKNVVASPFADKHYVESTMDLPKVREIAQQENVDYIMTACGDQPLLTVSTISNELGLPCYLTKSQMLNLTNKKYMKQMMKKSGIPTSNFRTFTDAESVTDDGLHYPLIVKPVDSNGSKGVRKVQNKEELTKAAEQAFAFSLSHTVIVEEFMDGVEVSLDYYVTGEKVERVMTCRLNKYKVDDATQIIYQSVIPAGISDKAQLCLDEIAARIAKAYGVSNSPLLIQAIVQGDDVNVVEFSARLGGGAKYKTIERVTGFNVLAANVQSMLGKLPEVKVKRDKKYYSRTHLYTTGGTFAGVEGVDTLKSHGVIEEYVQNRPVGGG